MASVVSVCARARARACVRLSESVCLGVLRKRICVQGVRCEACAMCVRRCGGDCACFSLCAARCVHPTARRIRLCAREGPSECVCVYVLPSSPRRILSRRARNRAGCISHFDRCIAYARVAFCDAPLSLHRTPRRPARTSNARTPRALPCTISCIAVSGSIVTWRGVGQRRAVLGRRRLPARHGGMRGPLGGGVV